MSEERRFDEKEIAAIFEYAARSQEAVSHKRPTGVGLSLAELQKIGAESGIEPEFIARAVSALDQNLITPPMEKFMGIPVSAAKTVMLPGRVSDDDWAQLVVDLRSTFQAKGDIEQEGSLRQWTNGNLHVFIEPAGDTDRLRMETKKSGAKAGMIAGIFYPLLGAFLLFASMVVDKPEPTIWGLAAFMAVLGFASIGWQAVTLPRWAKLRFQQMDAVGADLLEHMGSATPDPSGKIEAEPQLPIDEPAASEETPIAMNRRTGLRS